MDGKLLALLIVVVVFSFAYMERRQKNQLAMKRQQQAGTDKETAAAIKDLKKRVENLERIATDRGARLSDEIDAL